VSILRLRNVGAVMLLAVVAGCGGTGMHDVTGRVTDPTGAPLPEIRIVFIGKDNSVTATATTATDGVYRLGTRRPGEGSPAGDYTVLAVDDVPFSDSGRSRAPRIAQRYSDPALSGLEACVKPGRNRFDFQLDPQ
jgi:hypothetical protein